MTRLCWRTDALLKVKSQDRLSDRPTDVEAGKHRCLKPSVQSWVTNMTEWSQRKCSYKQVLFWYMFSVVFLVLHIVKILIIYAKKTMLKNNWLYFTRSYLYRTILLASLSKSALHFLLAASTSRPVSQSVSQWNCPTALKVCFSLLRPGDENGVWHFGEIHHAKQSV